MRLSALFKKSLLENFRDWKIIVLTLTFAPFFVYLMYFYLGASDLTSRVVIVNLDQGFKTAGGNTFHFAEDLMKDLKSAVSQEGRNIIHILEKETLEEARA